MDPIQKSHVLLWFESILKGESSVIKALNNRDLDAPIRIDVDYISKICYSKSIVSGRTSTTSKSDFFSFNFYFSAD